MLAKMLARVNIFANTHSSTDCKGWKIETHDALSSEMFLMILILQFVSKYTKLGRLSCCQRTCLATFDG